MSQRVFVLGVGHTPFGRYFDLTVKQLTSAAVSEALADADLSATQLQAGFFANASQGLMEDQHMIRGAVALRAMSLDRIPVFTVENACAGGSSAFNLACAYIRAGEADVALAVGVDKMVSRDKALSFRLFDVGWDVAEAGATRTRLAGYYDGFGPPLEAQPAQSRSAVLEAYVALARLHMKRFGTSPGDLAVIASKNHRHAVQNPRAQHREAMDLQAILSAREVLWPFTVPMCAPVSDGAAAAIVCSEAFLRRHGGARAIGVAACSLQSGSDRAAGDYDNHVSRAAGLAAYERAGIGPDAIDVAEVHDATAFGELHQTELLGFCGFGGGADFARVGATTLGGALPINTSGGLECRGHPLAATGLAQIHELVTQLRGEAGPRQVDGARTALAENSGGFVGVEEAVACVTILER